MRTAAYRYRPPLSERILAFILYRWPGRLLTAAIVAGGVSYCYKAGIEERDAEPPRLIEEKVTYTETHYHSSSKGGGYTTTSRHWEFVASDGGTCEVGRQEWAAIERGVMFKCPQLFGWRD